MADQARELRTYTDAPTFHDGLIAGEFPRVEESVLIVAGSGEVKRGTVLGRITASGKLKPYNNTASDGSETAVGILAADVVATTGDAGGYMYVTGMYAEAKLIGFDEQARADLRPLNIYVRRVG